MFESFKRERAIRKALEAIARQRVLMVLSGNVPVIEQSPPDAEWFDVAVRTCHIRGWVAVLYDSIPSSTVRFIGGQPMVTEQATPKTMYRLTEGGWAVIHREHGWLIATFWVALLSFIAAALAVIVTIVLAEPSTVERAISKPPFAGQPKR